MYRCWKIVFSNRVVGSWNCLRIIGVTHTQESGTCFWYHKLAPNRAACSVLFGASFWYQKKSCTRRVDTFKKLAQVSGSRLLSVSPLYTGCTTLNEFKFSITSIWNRKAKMNCCSQAITQYGKVLSVA